MLTLMLAVILEHPPPPRSPFTPLEYFTWPSHSKKGLTRHVSTHFTGEGAAGGQEFAASLHTLLDHLSKPNQPAKKTKHPMFNFQISSHKANETVQGKVVHACSPRACLGAQGERVASSGPALVT